MTILILFKVNFLTIYINFNNNNKLYFSYTNFNLDNDIQECYNVRIFYVKLIMH